MSRSVGVVDDTAKLGCAYPRCHPQEPSNPRKLAGRVAECPTCARLVVACVDEDCQDLGTYNRPFVQYCRRCGQRVDQAALWEAARQDGWTRAPGAVSKPRLVHDLTRLGAGPPSSYYAIALAMVRGVVAVHRSGHFLAILKPAPDERGEAVLWVEKRDPFPAPPAGGPPFAYPPVLLPDERHLLFSGTQGVLALDLWSCHGLSAKDNVPAYRAVRCAKQTVVAPPIPLGDHRVGILTRDVGAPEKPTFRWAVWELSAGAGQDEAFSSRLDSGAVPELPLTGHDCLCQEVDGRVITFSTGREHWVWRSADAAASRRSELKKTWPSDDAPAGTNLGLNLGKGHRQAMGPTWQSFLVQPRRAERFDWVFCVGQDPTNPDWLEAYEVEFASLRRYGSQTVSEERGAIPIGVAPDGNGLPRLHFRAGRDVWFRGEGQANHCFRGLPEAIVDLSLSGPLVVSVGEEARLRHSIGIYSLHHKDHSAVELDEGHRLLSRPLLWYHWLYTVELTPDHRILLNRRTVTFESPKDRS